MPTLIGSGVSTKLNSFIAGKEAATSAYYQLGTQNADIIITFISTIFEQEEVIKGIRSVMKNPPLIGCSSAGSILTSGSFKSSVSVFTINSDSISFSYGMADEIEKNPRLAGHKATMNASRSIKNTVKKQLYIMLYNGLSGNGTDILRGAQEVIGTSFPIIGGSAIDDLYFQKTYQYFGNNIYTDSIIGLLIGGNITIGIGKSSGWLPIGQRHRITKAKHNVIKEIDKKIAVEIYEEYFEKTFEEFKKEGIAKLGINYPLGIKGKKDYLIRTPIKVEDNGSLVLNAEISEGEEISLMIGDKNMVLDSVKEACLEAMKNIKNQKIKFATVFSNIGRLQLLRKEAQKEIEIIKNILGTNIPLIGCYTYGEYGPFEIYDAKGQSYFNNQSISIAVFSE